MRRALIVLVVLAALSGSAAAQTAAGPSVGFRAYGLVDGNTMAAADSFDAIFASHRMTAVGGGAEIDVWHHLFLRIAASRAQRTGSRVFVDGTDVFPLNIPLTVTMTPLEAGGGWRFSSRSRFAPYAGAAFISLAYQEVSDFAQSGENVNERYTGEAAFGGVDVTIWKGLFAGGEVQYRHIAVPDVATSVMHQFGESDLGGVTARVRVGFQIK